MLRSVAVAALFVAAFGGHAPSAQSAEMVSILRGLAERTRQYYDRFISIICTETVYHQDLRFNLAPLGRPRVTVFELNVTRDPAAKGEGEFRVERRLQSVNGKPARKYQRPECTDPKTGSPEPLGFLRAESQLRYRFSSVSETASGPPGTRALDFIETPASRVTITWKENCFTAEGGGHQGRVWFDPATFDVLRVDLRLSKPFLVPLPPGHFGIQPAIRVERSEETLNFSRVEFQGPDESVLLPASIETLNVIRGVPSMRIRHSLSDFRRFLAESKIAQSGS